MSFASIADLFDVKAAAVACKSKDVNKSEDVNKSKDVNATNGGRTGTQGVVLSGRQKKPYFVNTFSACQIQVAIFARLISTPVFLLCLQFLSCWHALRLLC